MRIDAHHHLWDLSAVHYPWLMEHGKPRFFGDPTTIQRNYLLNEFRKDAKKHQIKASVHIQVGAENGLEEAKWIQRVVDENPDWPLVQVAFCDLTAKNFETDLAELLKLPSLRGIRQIIGRAEEEDRQTGTNALLDHPSFCENLEILAQHNLSFDLQLIPSLLPRATEIFAQVPKLSIALCHAGSPHPRDEKNLKIWRTNLEEFSKLENSYCKLSGLGMFVHSWTVASFQPLVESVLDNFGADRTMFGSNFPVDSLTSTYSELFNAYEVILSKLNQEARDKIFGKTAMDFYNIAGNAASNK